RQPGSALKPFIYAEAFSNGFTPSTVLPDLETHFGARKGTYAPKNYDRRTHGPVRVREALANSFNVPAVRIADALGPSRMLATLRRAGFESLDKDADFYGLGLVLDNALRLPFATAAKTGTSKGYSDNWTIGFTRERTVAVWAGNFDGTPMIQVSGITGAGPIFKRVITRAMAGIEPSPLFSREGLD